MSVYSNQIGFAAGTLIGTQTNAAGVVTPQKFGILQDVDLSLTAELKELYGQKRFALAMAPGKTKIELKAKFAAISGNLFNQLFFGGVVTATQTLFADSEAANIPASTTFTVTAANGATFLSDEGVYYQTGLPLSKVATLAAAGQYIPPTGSPGVYTFDSADASLGVYLSYLYGTTAGLQMAITNNPMGQGPTFKVVLSQPFDSRQTNFIFNNCQASKLSFPTKQDDFTITEIDFMVTADASGNIGTMNTSL